MRIEIINLGNSEKDRTFKVNDIIKVNFKEKCILCVKPENPSEVAHIEIEDWDNVFIYAGDLEEEI